MHTGNVATVAHKQIYISTLGAMKIGDTIWYAWYMCSAGHFLTVEWFLGEQVTCSGDKSPGNS